jgi:hypothetical protein
VGKKMHFKYHGREIWLKGVDESDWIYTRIKQTGYFYEIDLLKYIWYANFGLRKGLVLDIGANIGNHSVFFGTYVADKVVSFEPNPSVTLRRLPLKMATRA